MSLSKVLWSIYDWFDRYPNVYLLIPFGLVFLVFFGWHVLLFLSLLITWAILDPEGFSAWKQKFQDTLNEHVAERESRKG
jgi:hypothetical protein